MIRIDTVFRVPETGFSSRQTEWRSPTLMVVRRRALRSRFSERVLQKPSKRVLPWHNLRLVVRGRLVLEADGMNREVGPGDLVMSDDWNGAPLRITSDEVETVLVAWEVSSSHAFFGRAHVDRARQPFTEAVLALSSPMNVSTAHAPVGPALRGLSESLVSEGFVEHGDTIGVDRCIRVPDAFVRFGRALQSLLGDCGERLMAVDLADRLACSERHALRAASAYFRSLHLTVDSWRDYAASLRLALAVEAMSSRGARTEVVSRALGFSSPVALCHAFAAAGLPSPGRLGDLLAS